MHKFGYNGKDCCINYYYVEISFRDSESPKMTFSGLTIRMLTYQYSHQTMLPMVSCWVVILPRGKPNRLERVSNPSPWFVVCIRKDDLLPSGCQLVPTRENLQRLNNFWNSGMLGIFEIQETFLYRSIRLEFSTTTSVVSIGGCERRPSAKCARQLGWRRWGTPIFLGRHTSGVILCWQRGSSRAAALDRWREAWFDWRVAGLRRRNCSHPRECSHPRDECAFRSS